MTGQRGRRDEGGFWEGSGTGGCEMRPSHVGVHTLDSMGLEVFSHLGGFIIPFMIP